MYSKTLDINWWLQKNEWAPWHQFGAVLRPDFDATAKQDQATTASFGSRQGKKLRFGIKHVMGTALSIVARIKQIYLLYHFDQVFTIFENFGLREGR